MTNRPRALAVLVAVFLLGGILAAGGTYLWLKNLQDPERRAMQNRFPGGPPQGRMRMQESLQLTPEQEEQFGKIMSESRRQMEAVRAEQQPKIDAIFSEQQTKMEAIVADTNRKVMAILNQEQQKKFESLWKEMNGGRRRPPHGGRGMGPMGPPSGGQ
jgi:hypothetical protein